MKVIPILAGGALALTAALGVPALAPADSGAVSAAEAAPYKIPRGTWGGTTYYKDVRAYWSGDAEVRFRQHNRMWYDGKKWVNKEYYFGYYYSGVTRA